jgi:GMP synthase (glutamine-hydrolysing)
MKKLYIIKTGATYSATAEQFGDFDAWTIKGLESLEGAIAVHDVERNCGLPAIEECAGVVITGSHSMVTDRLLWSIAIEEWIPSLLSFRVPLLGICYGHQLLAQAAGGKVDYHPAGKEMGTVPIQLLSEGTGDRLFRGVPVSFAAHVAHSQTVLSLPEGAVCLAQSNHEPHQAFRLGDCAWGVQFHPEYTADIMHSYIEEEAEELSAEGFAIADLLSTVVDTPDAAKTLRNFAQIVTEQN